MSVDKMIQTNGILKFALDEKYADSALKYSLIRKLFFITDKDHYRGDDSNEKLNISFVGTVLKDYHFDDGTIDRINNLGIEYDLRRDQLYHDDDDDDDEDYELVTIIFRNADIKQIKKRQIKRLKYITKYCIHEFKYSKFLMTSIIWEFGRRL